MSFQDFPPALMVLSPRLTKSGDPGSSVVGVITTPLADGAVAYCIENQLAYRLDKQSTAAPDGNLVLAPLNGPGRWLASGGLGPTGPGGPPGADGPTGPGGPPGADGPTGPSIFATGVRPNKDMVASTTVADGDLACATPVAVTPAASSTNGGYVGFRANGVHYAVGDGTKISVDCYFSGDGGVTARLMRDIVAGDLPYWNGSVATFQLNAATDRIDYDYDVST